MLIARAPRLPATAVALSAALWGLWWLPLRALAEAGLTGAAVNAALYGIATAALLPLFWRRRRRLAAGGLLLLGTGGLFGAALVSWNLALILGEVVRVTLLFYLAPVWATLLALTVLRRAASAGCACSRSRSGSPGPWCCSALPAACRCRARRATGSGLPPACCSPCRSPWYARARRSQGSSRPWCRSPRPPCCRWRCCAVAPHQTPDVDAVVLAWAALAALAWLLPVTWLLLWGARFLEPGRVSLLLLLEVAVAAISAALLAGEPFGPREAAGCLLILAAGTLEGAAALRPAGRRASALPPHAAGTAADSEPRLD